MSPERDKTRLRILDVGAGYGRIKTELEKKQQIDAEWILFNPDKEQYLSTCERFRDESVIHSVCRYDDIKKDSIDVVIVANVIHEITPPAFEELLIQARSKLKDDGQMYIIDMEPLLYGYSVAAEPPVRCGVSHQSGQV